MHRYGILLALALILATVQTTYARRSLFRRSCPGNQCTVSAPACAGSQCTPAKSEAPKEVAAAPAAKEPTVTRAPAQRVLSGRRTVRRSFFGRRFR